jgi:hypothetical protein
MSNFFVASYVVLWFLVGILLLLVLLLYRYFGLAFLRGQQRLNLSGLDIGSRAPGLAIVATGHETPIELQWNLEQQNGHLGRFLLFALPTCEVCNQLATGVDDLPAVWRNVEFVWIDGEPSNPAEDHSRPWPLGWLVGFSKGEEAHALMEVSAVPFAYTVAADGRILSKSHVNTVEDVKRVLEEGFADAVDARLLAVAPSRGRSTIETKRRAE